MTVETIAFAWIAVLGLALFIIGIASYRRSDNKKLIPVAFGFMMFFIKGAILSYSLFYDTFSTATLWLLVAVLDTLALIMIFIGIYKR